MKEMISPYRQTPSASPTKIKDLPRTLESSLIAPSAALAALATAIPPPIQERPVTSAAARYPIPVAIVAPEDVAAYICRTCKHHDRCNGKCAEEEKCVDTDCTFVAFFVLFTDQIISEWDDDT